jgi:hypothetical protein
MPRTQLPKESDFELPLNRFLQSQQEYSEDGEAVNNFDPASKLASSSLKDRRAAFEFLSTRIPGR